MTVAATEKAFRVLDRADYWLSSRDLKREGVTDAGLRALVEKGLAEREVRKSYETTSIAGREFGGVVTMRRRRAYYRLKGGRS